MDDSSPADEGRPRAFVQGLMAGLVLANFNKHLLLGGLVGLAGGMFWQQEFGAPDVKGASDRLRAQLQDIVDTIREK